MWSSVARVGCVCGALNSIAPDHLGILMTLSALTAPGKAFRIGAWWGLGHSLGTVVVCSIAGSVKAYMHMHTEAWEHYGGYLIGWSMILFALYFGCREECYLAKERYGTLETLPSNTFQPQHAESRSTHEDGCVEGCNDIVPRSNMVHSTVSTQTANQDPEEPNDTETTPLLPDRMPHTDQTLATETGNNLAHDRESQGACLGLLQALFCPTSLLGLSYAVGILTIIDTVCFVLAFVGVSLLGTGALTLSWSVITNKGISTHAGPTAVYRGSCIFTFLFGVGWLIALQCGYSLDYTNDIRSQISLNAQLLSKAGHVHS